MIRTEKIPTIVRPRADTHGRILHSERFVVVKYGDKELQYLPGSTNYMSGGHSAYCASEIMYDDPSDIHGGDGNFRDRSKDVGRAIKTFWKVHGKEVLNWIGLSHVSDEIILQISMLRKYTLVILEASPPPLIVHEEDTQIPEQDRSWD